jgi:hypothetical protein
VAGTTYAVSLITRETVAEDTPALRAMSDILMDQPSYVSAYMPYNPTLLLSREFMKQEK